MFKQIKEKVKNVSEDIKDFVSENETAVVAVMTYSGVVCGIIGSLAENRSLDCIHILREDSY